MIRQGGIWAALGAAVCLVIGLLIVAGGKKRLPVAATEQSSACHRLHRHRQPGEAAESASL